jgi:hypothetical protein
VIQADADNLRFLQRLAEVCWVHQISHSYSRDGTRIVPSITIRDLWEATSEHVLFLTPERVELLNQSMLDGRQQWGVRLWACRVRRERPGLHVVIDDPAIAAKFANCEDPPQVQPFIEQRTERTRARVDPAITHPGQMYGRTMTPGRLPSDET